LSKRLSTRRPLPFRPNPLAPIRVRDYWIVAVDGERCLLLSIRSGHAARLCKRVNGAGAGPPSEPAAHRKRGGRIGVQNRGAAYAESSHRRRRCGFPRPSAPSARVIEMPKRSQRGEDRDGESDRPRMRSSRPTQAAVRLGSEMLATVVKVLQLPHLSVRTRNRSTAPKSGRNDSLLQPALLAGRARGDGNLASFSTLIGEVSDHPAPQDRVSKREVLGRIEDERIGSFPGNHAGAVLMGASVADTGEAFEVLVNRSRPALSTRRE
jgi:hypothetical protein